MDGCEVGLGWCRKRTWAEYSTIYVGRETRAATFSCSSDNSSRRPDARRHVLRSRPRAALARGGRRQRARAAYGSSWTWGILPSAVILIARQSRLATRQLQSQSPNQVTGLPPPHASCVCNTRRPLLPSACSRDPHKHTTHAACSYLSPRSPQASSTCSSCHRPDEIADEFAAGEYDRLLDPA